MNNSQEENADKLQESADDVAKMTVTSASQEKLSGVDYDQVEPLQRKRLLKFVNHFVLQMANFVSNFSQTCDTKLMCISEKLVNLETSLVLLENKLDSVPYLKTLPIKQDKEPEPEQVFQVEEKEIKEETQEEPKMDESLIAPFKKMLQVGVPEHAVRQKMKLQGLDDTLLFFS